MELMVVIVIIVILTSSMIPIMSSASDARRCREGARLVSTMLSSAQTRAISTGRSCGVLFQPMKNNPYACMEMYLVEVPPPYSGDDLSYTAQIDSTGTMVRIVGPYDSSSMTYAQPTFAGVPMSNDPTTATSQNLIRPGDIIRFNYRGQTYLLNFGDPTQYTPFAVSHDPAGAHNPPWCIMTLTPTDPTGSYPPPKATNLQFQIFRQPIKTSDPPAQLSDGAAIDWYFSGVDLAPAQPPTGATNTNYPNPATNPAYPTKSNNAYLGNPPYMFGDYGTITASTTPPAPGPAAMANSCGPVIVSFTTTGALEAVYFSSINATASGNPTAPATTDINRPCFYQLRPTSGVYILVGRIEKIQQQSGPIQNDPDPNHLPNYQDSNARWVSVTRQSGLITTTEIAKLQPQYVTPGSNPPAFYLSPSGPSYPTSVADWAGVLNAVMNSRRYASGNQSAGGI